MMSKKRSFQLGLAYVGPPGVFLRDFGADSTGVENIEMPREWTSEPNLEGSRPSAIHPK